MLEDVKQNIERLIALYEARKAECESLRQALAQSEQRNTDCREKIAELEQQIDTMKLSPRKRWINSSGRSTDASPCWKSRMEQSITIKIAGTDYPLKASSPEMEQLMRIAAETINKKIAAYDARFPERSLADKLSFVALNETVSRLATQRKMEALADEAARLKKDTDDYLSQL